MFIFKKEQARAKEIYISKPNNGMLGPLDGITSAKFTPKFNDIWELDVSVDKYIDGVLSSKYDAILQYMELYVPDIGWFRITEAPKETMDKHGHTYKTFKAQGYEIQLQDVDVVNFYVNTGDELSYEFFDENLNPMGVPMRNIQLYIQNASDDPESDNYFGYGILNLLEKYYLRKWKFGEVDIELRSLRGRVISIESQNLYATLTQDISKAFDCIFEFDRENFIINVRPFYNIGKTLNIQASYRNLLNSMTISAYSDPSYTRFRVAGGNEQTSIMYVNFGSDYIDNLSYFMKEPYFKKEVVDKYNQFVSVRESKREEYANLYKDYSLISSEISEIDNRVPIDEVKIAWGRYSVEELNTELENFKAILSYLEKTGQNVEGANKYQTYLCIKDIIIPDIEANIRAKNTGDVAVAVDYKTNWELYGIIELESKKVAYEDVIKVYEHTGHNVPWTPEGSTSTSEAAHNLQYNQYLEYVEYVAKIKLKLTALYDKKNTLTENLKRIEDDLSKIRASVSIENVQFGFSQKELEDIRSLYIDTDFTDSSIEVQDVGIIDDVIDYSWDLYESAKKELEYRSRPQFTVTTEAENLFRIESFKRQADTLEIGDFIYLDLGDSNYSNIIKQRIISFTVELVNMDNTSLSLSFSNLACTAYGKADDYRFFFENKSGSVSKNSITQNNTSTIQSISASVALSVIQGYLGGGNSIFPNGLSVQDTQRLLDSLSGLIDGNISLDELKAKLAKIDVLEADNAFIKYLESSLLVSDKGVFKELNATIGNIETLLSGTIGAGNAQFINLTVDNTKMTDAFIKNLIASRISVADLNAHTMSGQTINIISTKTGDPAISFMNGTQQFFDSKGVVRVQIGQDASGNFNFIIRGEDGTTTLFDENGITKNAIPDGLIINDMIESGTIEKNKLGFPTIEANKFGGVDITQVYNGEDGLWGVQYDEFKTSTETKIKEIASMADIIELYADNQVFIEQDGIITPSAITITAKCLNTASVDSWYIDGVKNTTFVSSDKLSFTIPSSCLDGKKSIMVKCQNKDGAVYDIYTIYKISASSGITITLSSSEGQLFKTDSGVNSTVITCKVYKGTQEITPNSYKFLQLSDDNTTWDTIGTTQSVTIPLSGFISKSRIKCQVDV